MSTNHSPKNDNGDGGLDEALDRLIHELSGGDEQLPLPLAGDEDPIHTLGLTEDVNRVCGSPPRVPKGAPDDPPL